MFDAKELESLDATYFTVLYKDPFDVTIRSKNTGHFGVCTARIVQIIMWLLYFIPIMRSRIICMEGHVPYVRLLEAYGVMIGGS